MNEGNQQSRVLTGAIDFPINGLVKITLTPGVLILSSGPPHASPMRALSSSPRSTLRPAFAQVHATTIACQEQQGGKGQYREEIRPGWERGEAISPGKGRASGTSLFKEAHLGGRQPQRAGPAPSV